MLCERERVLGRQSGNRRHFQADLGQCNWRAKHDLKMPMRVKPLIGSHIGNPALARRCEFATRVATCGVAATSIGRHRRDARRPTASVLTEGRFLDGPLDASLLLREACHVYGFQIWRALTLHFVN